MMNVELYKSGSYMVVHINQLEFVRGPANSDSRVSFFRHTPQALASKID